MKNIISIPIFGEKDGNYYIIDYKKYEITYKHGKRMQLKIVVNKFLTTYVIDLNCYNSGYKNSILCAISEFENRNKIKNYPTVNKPINLSSLNCYNDKIINNIKNYLLPINKETSRDVLTVYNLIFDE